MFMKRVQPAILLGVLQLVGAETCDVVTVSDLPNNCIRGACGTCDEAGDLRANVFNGDWIRITDVGSQLRDMKDHTKGFLPVYTKSVNGENFFLFYDPQGHYNLAGTSYYPGWAIHSSIGTSCTDDFGVGDCGNFPPACCTLGPSCVVNPYIKLTKDTGDGDGCRDLQQDTWTYFRGDPQDSPSDYSMRIIGRRCRCVYSSCSDEYDTTTENTGSISCKSVSSSATTTKSALGLASRACPLGSPSYIQDCRVNRCQGASDVAYDTCFSTNKNIPDSCGCPWNDPNVSPTVPPPTAPTTPPSTKQPTSPTTPPTIPPPTCRPEGLSCSSNEECCGDCQGKRNRRKCGPAANPTQPTQPTNEPTHNPTSTPQAGVGCGSNSEVGLPCSSGGTCARVGKGKEATFQCV